MALLAQSPIEINQLDKKHLKKYNNALKHISNKDFDKATKDLNVVISKYPNFVEGQIKLSSLHLKAKNNDLAIQHLKYILDNNLSDQPKFAMTLADLLEDNGEYNQAIYYVKPLLENKRINAKNQKLILRRFNELTFRAYTYANPVEFDPLPISSSVNTSKSECLPAFNADGSVMIYTSLDQSAGRHKNEDLYMTTIDENGDFSQGESIASLNTFENEGAHTFSQDGSMIIFTACNRRDSYGGCDLYISFYKNGQWGKVYNMGPEVNSRFSDKQPSLSADNKTLYFSSTRKGGKGKEDIWKVSFINGKWSDAENLGDGINTSENEGSPFIHADDNTLYFRSDGHIGLGDYDLFVSKKKNTTWSEPKNLGHPINSKGNDGALFVDLFGNTAYYTSDKLNGGSHLDILKFELPEDLKPEPVSYLKINVKDGESQENLIAKVKITDVTTNSTIKSMSTTNDGALMVIPTGNFAVTVSKENYLFHSENINIDKSKNHIDPIEYNIKLWPIKEIEKKEISEPIVLHNIFFDSGSSKLLATSNSEIENLVSLLTNQPNIKIQIIGHTDDIGNEKDNLQLSTDRAKSVYEAIIAKGIDKNRLSYLGKGESEPISTSDTEEGRRVNRRTEFVVR